jgi:hypothetical protein
MATTTNYGWTTPDDTGLVKDGASNIRTLGSSIDTSMANLRGGTTGQVLRKTSATQMDFAWATASSGVTLLNTTSFSAVSSQPINTVFSSTYDCYKIILTLTASSGAPAITLRVRNGTTDLSAGDYYWGGYRADVNPAALAQIQGAGATSFGLGDITSAQAARYFMVIDIANPFPATATKVTYQGHYVNGTSFYGIGVGGAVANSSAYDGYNILASTGTITGKVVTYGYNI